MTRFRFTLVIAAACGCSSGAESAGPLPHWEMSAAPTVSIGLADGDSAYLFSRVTDARLLESGDVVVADGGASVVRVFNADGEFVRQFGRQGDGPGEFQYLRAVWEADGDTLGVWDSGARRLTYVDLTDLSVRTVPLTMTSAESDAYNLDLMAGVRSDGSVVIASLGFGEPDGTGADRVTAELFDTGGRHLGRLGETTGMVRGSNAPIPFSPFIYFAVDGDVVYSTNGWSAAVEVWSDVGVGEVAFPVTVHDVSAAWANLQESVRERAHPFFSAQLDDAVAPDTIPQLAGLVVDSEGLLWSKRYEPSTDALWLDGGSHVRGGEWWVADPESGPVAVVSVPDGVSPLQILSDRVLALATDSLGVERVLVLALERPSEL